MLFLQFIFLKQYHKTRLALGKILAFQRLGIGTQFTFCIRKKQRKRLLIRVMLDKIQNYKKKV